MFASEEEAFAAAEQVWIKYIDASNRFAASGGKDLAAFDGVVSDTQLEDEIEAAAQLRERDLHTAGGLEYSDFRFQQYHEDGAPGAYLQAYTCLEFGMVQVLDSSGSDVGVEGHDESRPYEVVFVTDGPKPPFMVEKLIKWTGRDFCAD